MSDIVSRPTRLLPGTTNAICEAAQILRQGGLVAFPTETVYGLGADAENPSAVRDMFAAKGRPADHPVILHVANAGMVEPLVTDIPPLARKLATAFWPGPMTLILRRSRNVSELVTGGLETVGLRVPSHPVAQSLLHEFGRPIAAPSANRFGRVSATCAEHVAAELTGRVNLILDGGLCPVGLESTIIDVSGERPAVLRPGAVTQEQISAVLLVQLGASSAAAPRVSGSLPSHYAPRARVEIVAPADLVCRSAELAKQGARVAVLTPEQLPINDQNVILLSTPTDQAEFGRHLYSLLRKVDEAHCDVALVTLPVEEGLGQAIADRLRRAAGPRDSG